MMERLVTQLTEVANELVVRTLDQCQIVAAVLLILKSVSIFKFNFVFQNLISKGIHLHQPLHCFSTFFRTSAERDNNKQTMERSQLVS